MKATGPQNEFLSIRELDAENCRVLETGVPDLFSVLWLRAPGNNLYIDDVEYRLGPNQMVFLTMLNQVKVAGFSEATLIQFNKEINFFSQQDTDVGCKGLLFFGSSAVPIITIPPAEVGKFELLLNVFASEMSVGDGLQVDMLQLLLQRFLILGTRIYREQLTARAAATGGNAIIREFNYLVECHYYEKHTVAEYAYLLNKSPKTLANSFLKRFPKTPLQIIQDRVVLEAKRQLSSTEKTISEIAYQIGFADIQTFGRFFKRLAGVSPKVFRAARSKGNNCYT